MSAELTRWIEDGIEELELLIKRKQGTIDNNYEQFKTSENIAVSAFANNLQNEVESLKMALLHRNNALKWYTDIQGQLKKEGGDER